MVKLSVKGHVKVWQDGRLVAEGSNMVVTDGLLLLAQRIAGESVAMPSLFKLGTSAALSSRDMTSLQGAIITSFSATFTRRENVLSWSGDYVHDDITEQNCREIGLFQPDANEGATPGRMLARFLPLQQFVIKSGTPIRVNWEIIVGE